MTAGKLLFKQLQQKFPNRWGKESQSMSHFEGGSSALLIALLLAFGWLLTGDNIHQSGIFWLSFYPVAAFFLKGRRQGLLWTALLYALIFALFIGHHWGCVARFAYSVTDLQRILISLSGLSALLVLYELAREKHETLREQENFKFLRKQVNLSKEIHERIRAEQALKASEERFHKLTEHSADALLVVNQQNIVRFMNPAAMRLFETQGETLIDKKFGVPVMQGESTEIEIPQRDGNKAIIEIRTVRIEWENQIAYLESLRDITEHKRIQEALQLSQIQLEATYRSEQERRRLSDTLRKVGRIVSSTLEQETVINSILAQLENVMAYHRVTVMLVSDDGQLSVVAARDSLPHEIPPARVAIKKYPINTAILESKQPILVPDISQDKRWQHSETTQGVRSFIGSPLLVHDRPIGILAVGRRDTTAYTQDDADTVFAFATQVAIAVHNAQLHAKTQERNRRLALLHEISMSINSSLEMTTLLTVACQKLVENFQVEHSGVLLFDKTNTSGEVVAEYPAENALGIKFQIEGNPLNESLIATAQPQAISDAQHDPIMKNVWEVMRSLEIVSILIVPLVSQGRVIGSFSLDVTHEQRHFSASEIELAQTIASQLAMAINNARLLEDERTRIAQELETARQIQMSLFPPLAPKISGMSIAGYSLPARMVGGDFYNYFLFEQQEFGIAVGDVSGKGMQSALMMALSFGLLSLEARSDVMPSELLARVNAALRPHTQRNRKNTALCYLRLSPEHDRQWRFSIANAGLIAPLLRRKDGSVEWLDVGGLPLGMLSGIEYPEYHGSLAPCDMLLVSSDGLVEAMNAQGEMYGFDRLTSRIQSLTCQDAETCREEILADIRRFVGYREAHDDLTLVVIMAVDQTKP